MPEDAPVPASTDSAWRASLRVALDRLPRDYPACCAEIARLRHEFLQEISAALAPRLNAHLAHAPQESLVEKRQLATTVNQDLRALNLCVRCPHTGLPAIIVADFRDHPDQSSRFRYQVVEKSGRTLKKGVAHHLESLDLMEAPAREEPLAGRRPSPPDKGSHSPP